MPTHGYVPYRAYHNSQQDALLACQWDEPFHHWPAASGPLGSRPTMEMLACWQTPKFLPKWHASLASFFPIGRSYFVIFVELWIHVISDSLLYDKQIKTQALLNTEYHVLCWLVDTFTVLGVVPTVAQLACLSALASFIVTSSWAIAVHMSLTTKHWIGSTTRSTSNSVALLPSKSSKLVFCWVHAWHLAGPSTCLIHSVTTQGSLFRHTLLWSSLSMGTKRTAPNAKSCFTLFFFISLLAWLNLLLLLLLLCNFCPD